MRLRDRRGENATRKVCDDIVSLVLFVKGATLDFPKDVVSIGKATRGRLDSRDSDAARSSEYTNSQISQAQLASDIATLKAELNTEKVEKIALKEEIKELQKIMRELRGDMENLKLWSECENSQLHKTIAMSLGGETSPCFDSPSKSQRKQAITSNQSTQYVSMPERSPNGEKKPQTRENKADNSSNRITDTVTKKVTKTIQGEKQRSMSAPCGGQLKSNTTSVQEKTPPLQSDVKRHGQVTPAKAIPVASITDRKDATEQTLFSDFVRYGEANKVKDGDGFHKWMGNKAFRESKKNMKNDDRPTQGLTLKGRPRVDTTTLALVGVDAETTISDIRQHLITRGCRLVGCVVLNPRSGRDFTTAKITVPQRSVDTLLEEGFWPDEIKCREWFTRTRKYGNYDHRRGRQAFDNGWNEGYDNEWNEDHDEHYETQWHQTRSHNTWNL